MERERKSAGHLDVDGLKCLDKYEKVICIMDSCSFY